MLDGTDDGGVASPVGVEGHVTCCSGRQVAAAASA